MIRNFEILSNVSEIFWTAFMTEIRFLLPSLGKKGKKILVPGKNERRGWESLAWRRMQLSR